MTASKEQDLYEKELERFREALRTDTEQATDRYGVTLINSLTPAERALALRDMGVEITEPLDFYNLGCHFAAEDNWSQAIDYFRQAIEADPDLIDAIYNMAICYEKTGHIPQAKSTWEVYLDACEDEEECAKVREHVGALEG